VITKALTGHMYYRSPYECDDDCDTCDGAKCEWCEAEYNVHDRTFSKHADAEAYEKENEIKMLSLTGMPDIDIHDATFYIKDGVLLARFYEHGDVVIDVNSPFYQDVYDTKKSDHDKWDECTCTDKEEEHYGNTCCIRGCDDVDCYYEMKVKGRTKKKWYC